MDKGDSPLCCESAKIQIHEMENNEDTVKTIKNQQRK